jgi:phosphinothricin acetyltransferase
MILNAMTVGDYRAVTAIYREGIATGNATFETDAPAWEAWDKKYLRACRLVAREGEAVLGWAALTPVSARAVYAGVAEVSVYVAAAARGRGVGKVLLSALVEESERAGLWTLQAGIFPENAASIVLHKQCGFRELGVREKIGCMNGVWRDVALLERRSRVVGV